MSAFAVPAIRPEIIVAAIVVFLINVFMDSIPSNKIKSFLYCLTSLLSSVSHTRYAPYLVLASLMLLALALSSLSNVMNNG